MKRRTKAAANEAIKPPRIIGVKEVADRLNISVKTLYAYLDQEAWKRGAIPEGKKIGGKWGFFEPDVDAHIIKQFA